MDIMDVSREFVALWTKQYIAMLQIQFPEFFRSAITLLKTYALNTPVERVHRLISQKYFTEEQQNKDEVRCEVLYNPPPGMHCADIIIIHGLHGSTYKTWRQGVYKCDEVKKFQLRQHIPVSSEEEKRCSKCNLHKKSNNSYIETKNFKSQFNDSVEENKLNYKSQGSEKSQANQNLFESFETNALYDMNNLMIDDDDILYSNINLIRNSFCSSKADFGERIEALTDGIAQSDSNFLILEDGRSLGEDFCDCMFSRSTDSFRSGKSSKIFCDSNLTISNQFKYSNNRKRNALEELCLNCKKRQKLEASIPRLRKPNKVEENSITFESLSISDGFFEEFDKTYQRTRHDSYKYNDSVSNTRVIYEGNFISGGRRQSVHFCDDDEYSGEEDKFSNDFIEYQKAQQNDNYCDCMAKERNTSIFHEDMCLRYVDIYGNSPRLLKQIFFVIRFIFSFAKEAYSLYRKLWDYSNRSEELSNCWPQDWLPIDCPNARVISINYTTFLWNPIWSDRSQRKSLQEKSLEMARQLEKLDVGKYPIVWAAHSKGGLFVKQMFINSWCKNSGVSNSLFTNTNTMVFYSVPQHGSILAHFFTAPFVIPSIEITEIQTGSKMIRQLQMEFREALKASKESRITPPKIVSYTETIPTNMSGVLLQIVFPTSADLGVGELYGIPLDHRMICKFASRDSVLYKDLVQLVERAHKTKIV
ncbi:uncharacterized protein LOC143921116 [Arctopsyche grandis]|uniref:uncharacterized protein LOC143921116 n=1 Tax=Arctopsyche grandis TaxID=121162 RepID=UPI00406D936A